MGRVSRAVAERHHQELVAAAARLCRERDLGAVSVPDVMGQIGLTRGGFYKHFESKDALIAAAVEQAFCEHVQRVELLSAEQGHDPVAARQAFIDFCLSPTHRDDPGTGCPSALASGISRSELDSAPRKAFTDGMNTLLQALIDHTDSGGADEDTHRERVVSNFAHVVGALLLSRATAGSPLSDEILTAVRRRLDAD